MSKKTLGLPDSQFNGMLLGLATQVKEYQLCWHLNKTLNFKLERGDDVEIVNKKKCKTSVFSFFRYEDDLDKKTTYLVSNKHFGEFLIPEVKQADYLLLIISELTLFKEENIVQQLKDIPILQLVIILEYSKLKSRHNLIFE
ncbi:MAG: IPExxxVDY family protein [Chitinophagales bacterium]|nr:IPExxxVDY family protein [Chitinophagales bacterium]